MQRTDIDNRKLTTLALVGLFGIATATLAGCNTTEGIGEDISAAGDAIDAAADDAND